MSDYEPEDFGLLADKNTKRFYKIWRHVDGFISSRWRWVRDLYDQYKQHA